MPHRSPIHLTRLIICSIACSFVLLSGCQRNTEHTSQNETAYTFTDLQTLETAARQHRSNIQVTQQGQVLRLLPDDVIGSRHQRFIIGLSSGQTVLVAHNIDLAPRILHIARGNIVTFRGEYEWNERGGVIHWTHHDPDGKHEDGWIKYQGKTYQ